MLNSSVSGLVKTAEASLRAHAGNSELDMFRGIKLSEFPQSGKIGIYQKY